MEAIGPITCTRDGVYLAGGGALSGNAYLWEVSNYHLILSFFAYEIVPSWLLRKGNIPSI